MKILRTAVAVLAVMTFLVAPAMAETIKVGAIIAETGKIAFLGAPEAKTLRMLTDSINASGGVGGNQIELVLMDSKFDSEKAISFAKQLIEEKKVFAIIGPSSSGETMKVKGIAEEGKTILLSLAAAEAIVNPVAKYVFKTPQKDSYAVQWIYEHMQKKGVKKVGIVAGGTGFGKHGMKQLQEAAPKYGIEVAIAEIYSPGATDLTAVATKVKGAGVDAVINWSVVPAQSIFAKNMRQIGMKAPLYQSHGFGNVNFIDKAGAAAEGIIFPAGRLLVADVLPEGHPQKAMLAKYKKDYESKYGEPVSTFGGHAYDAFMILMKAIEAAGTDREKVRDAIENMQGFVGTGGIFNFSAEDHNGLGIDSFEMLTVKDGKFTLLGN